MEDLRDLCIKGVTAVSTLPGDRLVHLCMLEAVNIMANHIHHFHPRTQDICIVIKNAELQAVLRPGSLKRRCRFHWLS